MNMICWECGEPIEDPEDLSGWEDEGAVCMGCGPFLDFPDGDPYALDFDDTSIDPGW